MTVGFDIRPLIFTKAGIRTYTYNLIVSLAKIPDVKQQLFVSSKSSIDWKSVSNTITENVLRLPHVNAFCGHIWQEAMLPVGLQRRGVEVFHGTRFFVPRRCPCPSVVTIHDVAFKKFPSFVTRAAFRDFDRMVADSLKRADKIIVPSQTTRDDLTALYGAREQDIVVTLEGPRDCFRRLDDPPRLDAVKQKFGIKRRFVLYAGTIEPRKNVNGLLKAYHDSKAKNDFDLVICGDRGWLYEETFAVLNELGPKDNVILPGHVSTEELTLFYNACEAFVFPSLYEGFGLPVLEAMNCGAAVITSDTSSLKELFSDTAYLVDPNSTDSIKCGLEAVLYNDSLRADLKAKALEKARRFSWDTVAQKTHEVYCSIV